MELTQEWAQKIQQGLDFLQSGKVVQARSVFQETIEIFGETAEACHFIGLIYLTESDFQRACSWIQRSLTYSDRDVDAWSNLSIAQLRSNQSDKALESANIALKLNDKFLPALNHKALALIGLHRFEEAHKALNRAISIDSDFGSAHSSLGELFLKQNNFSDSQKSFKKSLECNPKDLVSTIGLARALESDSRETEAITLLEKAIESSVNLDLARYLNQLYIKQGSYLLARQLAVAILKEVPEDIATLVNLGICQKNLNEDFAPTFQKALSLDQSNHTVLFNWALGYQEQEQYSQAIKLYQKVLGVNPHHWDALHNLAICYRLNNDLEKAIETHRQLITIFPKNTVHWYHLIDSQTTIDSTDIQSFKERVSDLEADAYLSLALAKVHRQEGDFKSSAHCLIQGNDIRWQSVSRSSLQQEFERIGLAFQCLQNFQNLPDITLSDCPQKPIFLVGLPKSGTELLETVLTCHSQLETAGTVPFFDEALNGLSKEESESPEVFDLVRAIYQRKIRDRIKSSSKFIIDSMPLNFLNTALILKAIPEARIIIMRKDPRDLALALYETYFQSGFSYSFHEETLSRYLLECNLLLNEFQIEFQKQILTVFDDEIEEKFENSVRRIVKFCNVREEKGCFDFELQRSCENRMNYLQSGKIAYQNSTREYLNYEQLLPLFQREELKQALDAYQSIRNGIRKL